MWRRKQFGVQLPISIFKFSMWHSIIPLETTTSFTRHIIIWNAVTFPNQVVGGREYLLNKGNFLSPTPLLTPTQKLGNHRVLWHLASNHFVSTFDNDGIMAHPTHQRWAQLEPRPALDLTPDSAITGSKKEINNQSECGALAFSFSKRRRLRHFFVVSFIFVTNIFT